jgi:membrane-bound lytic murein transglycosylase D
VASTPHRLSLVFALLLLLSGCAGKQPVPPVADTSRESGSRARSTGNSTPEGSALVEPEHPPDPGTPEGELDPRHTAGYAENGQPSTEDIWDHEPSDAAARALEAFDSAEAFWQEGDFDDALISLDYAYELMLEIPADAGPILVQEKEDLRRLISRRILDIYRSQHATVIDPSSSIQLITNTHIEKEIKRFQGSERDFFIESYRRSGRYRPMILEALEEAGLPAQLSWLPLVESGFKVRALSKARALGLWQFISSTGLRYGLSRDRWVDQRMDPEKSTKAAIQYLAELEGLFGDWDTALAAYNCGESRVRSVINAQSNDYLDDFWDIYELLPRETRRYVPRFLATLLILDAPDKYGFSLPEPDSPVEFQAVSIGRQLELAALDRALGLKKGTLQELNPVLRRGVTPEGTYLLNVPPGAASALTAKLDEIPRWVAPEETYAFHRVRRGETVGRIAMRYGTSVSAIARANNMRNANRIRPGQKLRIPLTRAAAVSGSTTTASSKSKQIDYTVRRGDSLWRLAKRFGTTAGGIKQTNRLKRDRLTIGQKLKIPVRIPAATRTYIVRRQDTLSKIADSHNVSLSKVMQANGLDRESIIHPGQELIIPD